MRIEKETGNPVITNQNAASLNSVVTGMIEEVTKAEEKQKKHIIAGEMLVSIKEMPTWKRKLYQY